MGKLRLLSVIFIILEVIALIPLTVEIFGDMNVDIITVSAAIALIGLLGSCVCTFIRGIKEWKKKKVLKK